MNQQEAKEILEKLFSDSTGENYPFTEEFGEAVRIAIQVLEQPQKDCSECTRRKFYQQGYEDGLNADKWIPCSDNLPKEKGLYLVTRKSGEVDCDFFETYANTSHFNAYGEENNLYIYPENEVIAWQPRPKPYKPQ